MNDVDIGNTLTGSFLLVDLTMRCFSGFKKDSRASNEVTANADAISNAAKVTKDLLAGARIELKAVVAAQGHIRSFLYRETLPWSAAADGDKAGARLLAAKKSLSFLAEYKTLVVTYEAARDAFLGVYDLRRQQAMVNLGGLADAQDYPTASRITDSFSVDMSLMPVPAATDFSRLTLPVELTQALAKRISSQQLSAMKNAVDDLRGRIKDELARMVKQLGDFADNGKGRLYGSLVGNMRGLVGLLRDSNIDDDTKLDDLAADLDTCLLHSIDTLRASPALARDVSVKALKITGDLEEGLYF